jgi:putative ABC transport system permease protein
VSARASSLRKVNWDSLRANFFVIMPSRLLAEQPKSFITAFHLPAGKGALAAELVREMPNLTVLDTSAIFRQVQAVLDQVIAAIEFLFLFTLAAGVLVLYAALAATFDERVREAGLLRALGASRQQLSRAQTAEMICLGGLAGLLAAGAASAVGWTLARSSRSSSTTRRRRGCSCSASAAACLCAGRRLARPAQRAEVAAAGDAARGRSAQGNRR